MVCLIKIFCSVLLISSIISQEDDFLPNDDTYISFQFIETEVGQTFLVSIAGENTNDKKWIWKNEKIEGNIINLIEQSFDGIASNFKFVTYNPGNIELQFEYINKNKTEILHLVNINVIKENELDRLIKQWE
jgi:hypothetical protein